MSTLQCPTPATTYPGTNRQVVAKTVTVEPESDPDRWDAHPRQYTIGGRVVDFFPIGALAKALRRRPTTIRRWEAEGIIPVSLWRSPSEHERGKVRLYSRELVEGMIQIAREEGLLDHTRKQIDQTEFRARVYALFTKIAKAQHQQRRAA
jgi:DNA-binding transcriptional MerR regulator